MTDVEPTGVEADPKRPYKAIAAFLPGILAMLLVLADEGKNFLPPWALLLISSLIAGIATYVVRNPKVRTRL